MWVWLLACGQIEGADTADTGRGALDTSTPSSAGACAGELPVRRVADADAAARGKALFVEGTLGDALLPRISLRNLWLAWGGLPVLDDEAYWAQFRDRYGLVEAPWPNDGYPMGIHAVDGVSATIDCLLCHSDRVAGEPLYGVGNSRLDFQALIDDLLTLKDLSEAAGLPAFELPYTIADRSPASGVVDGVGLGMQMSLLYGPPGADIETHYGGQQAGPWWTLRYRDRVYADGTGDVRNHRSMASTLLAFGMSFAQLQAVEDDLLDLQAMMWDVAAPAWPFPVDASLAGEGRAIYQARCAECHGDVCDPAIGFPDRIVATAQVGTDPTREAGWTSAEATWASLSWFGAPGAMIETDGYQANPLHGVWASAPYLHNGTVPDLASLLDSAERPAVWRRTGAEAADYDPDRVGWRYTRPDPPADRSTPEARRVIDTTEPGLSSAGHTYGDDLSEVDRARLLEFLKIL